MIAKYGQELRTLITILGVLVIFDPHLATARISSAPPQEWPLPLKDNLDGCDTPVRAILSVARQPKRWGPFHFDCQQGTVIRIQAPLGSRIMRQWPQFVLENSELFGVDAADLSPSQPLGNVVAVIQKFHGAKILPHFGNIPSDNKVIGNDLIVATNFMKTKGWTFAATISSTTASKIAQKGWDASFRGWDQSYQWTGHSDIMGQAADIATYTWGRLTNSAPRAKDATLVIMTDQPACIRCKFELPSPVWIVTPTSGDGDCEINAVTGEICNPCSLVATMCSL